MACSQPFTRYLTREQCGKTYFYDRFNTYPCGWCLNCRVDKRNSLTHRCEKELIDKHCGAFVTFTYDDPHIIKLLRKTQRNELVATLSKSDAKHFLDRLNKIIHKMPNTPLSRHDYTYLIVGEYGERGQQFDRPHFHLLTFGLDYAFCKRAFLKAWQGKGQIQIGSIQDGGIGYVVKYTDKQLFGSLAKEKYDQNNLERPFCHHSTNFGTQIYKENLEYAMQPEHYGCYRWKGKDVPYPVYYKNKYLLKTDKSKSFLKRVEDYRNFYCEMPKNLYDLKNYSLTKAQARERTLFKKMTNDGTPALDVSVAHIIYRPDKERKSWLAYEKKFNKWLYRMQSYDEEMNIPF